jgi:UTP--glucose-1-phosphate uridylyltransferase
MYINNLINTYKLQTEVHWDDLTNIEDDKFVNMNSLNNPNMSNLSKLGIVKLNGGLGTSMGLQGPKCELIVKDDLSFLDIVVNQIYRFNLLNHCNIPLILMNSYNTHIKTLKLIEKYDEIKIICFQQSFVPRLDVEFNVLTNDELCEQNKQYFYPPGHGDIYKSLLESNINFSELGIEYLFISNIDNLGATINKDIYNHVYNYDIPFAIEMTPKTKLDVKGGTIVYNKDKYHLLEVAQVPVDKLDEFCDITKFKYFNTNNLYIKIGQLKEYDLPVIYNKKKLGDKDIIQLETAMASIINFLPNSRLILVNRSRFLPVKKWEDLERLKFRNMNHKFEFI